MLANIDLTKVLFLDIETVPLYEHFDQLSSVEQKLFSDKTAYQRRDGQTPEEYYDRAGIWAEFGKIICISVGYFASLQPRDFRVTTFGGDERQLLQEFSSLLDDYFNSPEHLLCAHNGKEFDFPYIARRMVIHGLPLPTTLQHHGKKPWQIPHLDTLELWKFGDYKNFTSLKLLTHVLGIPSPKDDIDGSMVRDVFYKEKDLPRISEYCEKDVIAIAQVLLRMRRQELLTEDEISKR